MRNPTLTRETIVMIWKTMDKSGILIFYQLIEDKDKLLTCTVPRDIYQLSDITQWKYLLLFTILVNNIVWPTVSEIPKLLEQAVE